MWLLRMIPSALKMFGNRLQWLPTTSVWRTTPLGWQPGPSWPPPAAGPPVVPTGQTQLPAIPKLTKLPVQSLGVFALHKELYSWLARPSFSSKLSQDFASSISSSCLRSEESSFMFSHCIATCSNLAWSPCCDFTRPSCPQRPVSSLQARNTISLLPALGTVPSTQQKFNNIGFSIAYPHPTTVFWKEPQPQFVWGPPISEYGTMYFCESPLVLWSWVRRARRLKTQPWEPDRLGLPTCF